MNPLAKLRRKLLLRDYDFRRLIDTRHIQSHQDLNDHIICDIDKTYLETNTEGAIQMIRIAFEEAKDKVAVPGASPFLIAARWGNPFQLTKQAEQFKPRSLHFVSASPPQLRRTLEDKLLHDGLDWNSDSFKNQAYNLRMGRLGLLRHHVAYKTATILEIMHKAQAGSRFFLIGDNAEFDAYIYQGLNLFLQGFMSADSYETYLCAGGVQIEVAADLRELMAVRPPVTVAGILIRKAPGFHMPAHPPLTDPLVLFDDYFEALIVLIRWGLIEAEALPRLTREFHNHHGFSRERLLACLQLAESDIFAGETETLTCIKNAKELLQRAGEVKNLPSLAKILPASRLDQCPLPEDELVEQAKAWAVSLASNNAEPATI